MNSIVNLVEALILHDIDKFCVYTQDIVTRYAHQSGYHVERRFGWDCHGLPVVWYSVLFSTFVVVSNKHFKVFTVFTPGNL